MHRTRAVLVAVFAFGLIADGCSRRPILPSPDVLARHATIRRDTLGIPHIVADSEEAAAFAFGYAQAEDHAVEIGQRYVAARGEMAKTFGASGLENDIAVARFDNVAEARRGLQTISTAYLRIISAYAAGVNRYVARHRDALPEWMPTIGAEDVLGHTRASAATALGGPGLLRQLRNKYEPAPAKTPDVIEAPDLKVGPTADAPDLKVGPTTEAPGSNALALSGSRTSTGKPILLGNPHLTWGSLYWEAHVRVPGAIDFYGSTLAGIPVLRAGFNDRLAFVTTNNAPDLDDVYALKLDPARPDHYLFDGRSVPIETRHVTVQIRAADGSMNGESHTFWRTPIGPVVYRTADRIFVVKSARLDALSYFEGFYLLSKARSLREWLAAARRNLVPTSNFTYADADGNVLYLWNARLPVRAGAGKDYRLDVPASTSTDIWSRVHAVDDLPRLLNPPGGYIQNANNPPQFVSLRDPIDMSRYPSYFERGQVELRPQLALDMLESRQSFTPDEVVALKYSTRMLLAERVRQPLIDAVRAKAVASELMRAGADALEAWDGRVSAGSRGAVLFQRFWDAYAAKVRPPYATPWSAADPIRTPAGLASPDEAVAQLEAAVRDTRQRHGDERVAWGDVNRFRFGDIDLPGDGASGTYGCYRVLRFEELPGNAAVRVAGRVDATTPIAGFGDAWVLLVDFSGPVQASSVLAYGQSSDLSSPHSRDQIRTFAEHRLRPAWFTESQIRANLEREYRP